MSEKPPVQPPDQPAASTPPTQPMPAAGPPAEPPTPSAEPTSPVAGPPTPVAGSPTPPVGSPAAPTSGYAPRASLWSRTTSTRGGRWGLAIAAGALVCLMILVVGVAGLLVLRNHDRVNLMGQRFDYSQSQIGPGDGQGPLANGKQDRKAQKQQRQQMEVPGMPGGQGQGLGGLGNLLGGTDLHGDVTRTLNGSVQTLVFQRGQVTAVSDTSITLKSADGFVGTYGRNATTRSRGAAPVKGGQAFVLARSSDKVAITVIATPDMAGVGPSN